MKFYVKVILSLLVGVFLELTVFQLGAWRARFDPSAPKDQRYELADMTAVNWEKDGDAYISGADPILLLPSEGMRVYRVTAGFSAEPKPGEITLYYQKTDGSQAAVQGDVLKNRAIFSVNKTVGPELRLDIGEEAGRRLDELSVVVNPTGLDISVSRIVAVVLVYVCGSLLFRIQRMPDYTRYIQKKE